MRKIIGPKTPPSSKPSLSTFHLIKDLTNDNEKMPWIISDESKRQPLV